MIEISSKLRLNLFEFMDWNDKKRVEQYMIDHPKASLEEATKKIKAALDRENSAYSRAMASQF
ncbi:hypothetical protein KKE34_00795 [Patescibacteria group bacterium]|nr:hypothetical protein [Patescibacteria group bacterium]MBU1885127.1 hypothetical protein [Patescibacteria group bacterium]